MSENSSDPGASAAARNQRMRQNAEHRALVQATMHAKRSGKLPARRASSGSEVFTALLVVVVVIGMLVLVMRSAG